MLTKLAISGSSKAYHQAKEKPLKRNVFKGFGLGAICGTRTHDLLITNQLLYQLS